MATVSASARSFETRISPTTPSSAVTRASRGAPLRRVVAAPQHGTLGGNVAQRTRCSYFRDVSVAACNKRARARLRALGGYTRMHACSVGARSALRRILDMSWLCWRSMPSSARAPPTAPCGRCRSPTSTRSRRPPEIEKFFHGELITHVDLPGAGSRRAPTTEGARPRLVRVRARVGGRRDRSRRPHDPRARSRWWRRDKPWRSASRAGARGKPARSRLPAAAQAAMHGAVAQTDNAFKIDLARRTLVRALTDLGGA